MRALFPLPSKTSWNNARWANKQKKETPTNYLGQLLLPDDDNPSRRLSEVASVILRRLRAETAVTPTIWHALQDCRCSRRRLRRYNCRERDLLLDGTCTRFDQGALVINPHLLWDMPALSRHRDIAFSGLLPYISKPCSYEAWIRPEGDARQARQCWIRSSVSSMRRSLQKTSNSASLPLASPFPTYVVISFSPRE